MALSLVEFRKQLIYETGPVSRSSTQCHIVPSVALVIFPNFLHECRERQNWFAWKKGKFIQDVKCSVCRSLNRRMKHKLCLFMGTFLFH